MLFTKVVNDIWEQMKAMKNSNLSDFNFSHPFPILYLILENKKHSPCWQCSSFHMSCQEV